MSAFEGTFTTPKSYDATKKRIRTQHFVMGTLGFSALATSVILYFALTQIYLDEWIIYTAIGADAVAMLAVILFLKSRNDRVKKTVERVRGQEVLFYSDHIEFAGTLFMQPNPRAALDAPHPYLKIQYRDIQTVHVTKASGNGPATIVLTLMNDNRIILFRDAFADVEKSFFQALHSHKVSVP